MPARWMMPAASSPHFQSGALKHNLIAIPLVALALIAMVWMAFPPSYKTDLSQIGNGKAAIVLTFDKDNVASMDLMEGYNQIRSDYEEHIEFYVADLGSQQGQHFATRHRMPSAAAVYFSPEGEKRHVIYGPQERTVLIDSIHKSFGL